METLPAEILELILLWNVRHFRCDKNKALQLREVCKAFDAVLKPYLFKAVQLEFSRFLKDAPPLSKDALARVGALCEAISLDLMVVRDEEEISRLSNVFLGVLPKVPEVGPLLESLRRYSLTESTFDEMDFRQLLEDVFEHTPNMKRLKLNLPFQVVGQRSRTATLLLATTLASLAKRSEEHRVLETLVIDHISDTSVIDICNNPIDLVHTIHTLGDLEHLIFSIKRQESQASRQIIFSQNIWFLLRKARNLKSLCVIGWNTKRDIHTRRHAHGVSAQLWDMRSLPYSIDPTSKMKHLRFLELKRVDITAESFLNFIKEVAPTLKEVYLNEVYLKVHGAEDLAKTALWIGHSNVPQPDDCYWIAPDLRNIEELNLGILRATGLGYDDFRPDENSLYPNYDLGDPSTESHIYFDRRFVEAFTHGPSMEPVGEEPNLLPESQETLLPNTNHMPWEDGAIETAPIPGSLGTASTALDETPEAMAEYDAELFQRSHNTTSQYKNCIDGYFSNHNEQTLKVLQNIITIADKGMSLITAEIDRARYEQLRLATFPERREAVVPAAENHPADDNNVDDLADDGID